MSQEQSAPHTLRMPTLLELPERQFELNVPVLNFLGTVAVEDYVVVNYFPREGIKKYKHPLEVNRIGRTLTLARPDSQTWQLRFVADHNYQKVPTTQEQLAASAEVFDRPVQELRLISNEKGLWSTDPEQVGIVHQVGFERFMRQVSLKGGKLL